MNRTEFKKNYTGVFDPDKYFDYLQDCSKAEQDLSNATYSNSTNRKLVESAKQQAFNRHLRNAR